MESAREGLTNWAVIDHVFVVLVELHEPVESLALLDIGSA